MRNLIKRGRIFYFRKQCNDPVTGKLKVFCESLHTDDPILAREKLKVKQQELVNGELDRLRGRRNAATLDKIIEARKRIGVASPRSIYCACQALVGIFKAIRGNSSIEPNTISASELNDKLVRDYQDALRNRYETELLAKNPNATGDERSEVRDRADRTSRSLVKQAKSIFAKKYSLVTRYKEMGLTIPDSIKSFMEARVVGSTTTKIYMPPDDLVLARTFSEIDLERTSNPELWHVFWAALGFGGRKNEVMDLQVANFVDIDGLLWINGGRGKDRREIQLPVINWPVHPSSPTVPADVIRQLIQEARAAGRSYLFNGTEHRRQGMLPRMLNAWLAARGWNDDKKMHNLRAYVGSLLFSKDPHLAKDYLRHKSFLTTEQFYTQFFRLKKISRLQLIERPEILQTAGVNVNS